MNPRKFLFPLILLAALAGFRHFFSPGNYKADQIAAAETRMWKAYYGGDHQALGKELLATLRVQFGLSFTDALIVARDLGEATVSFQTASGSYESQALPGLRRAYERIRKATGVSWDPEAAARAELEWWVKRRTPGEDSPEEVGRSIAKLYAILYGETNAEIERAGVLRAQAADLRDRHGDWGEVEALLKRSYRALIRGIS